MIEADTYVIRIYRRERGNGESMSGVVELVQSRSEMPFSSFDELRRILSLPLLPPGRRRKQET